jgi:hypothetical protein
MNGRQLLLDVAQDIDANAEDFAARCWPDARDRVRQQARTRADHLRALAAKVPETVPPVVVLAGVYAVANSDQVGHRRASLFATVYSFASVRFDAALRMRMLMGTFDQEARELWRSWLVDAVRARDQAQGLAESLRREVAALGARADDKGRAWSGGRVGAVVRTTQALEEAAPDCPHVRRGTLGVVVSGSRWPGGCEVDFGPPWGVVLCEDHELVDAAAVLEAVLLRVQEGPARRRWTSAPAVGFARPYLDEAARKLDFPHAGAFFRKARRRDAVITLLRWAIELTGQRTEQHLSGVDDVTPAHPE